MNAMHTCERWDLDFQYIPQKNSAAGIYTNASRAITVHRIYATLQGDSYPLDESNANQLGFSSEPLWNQASAQQRIYVQNANESQQTYMYPQIQLTNAVNGG